MTEKELSEIEARANAATPGPWSTFVCCFGILHVAKDAHSSAEHQAGDCDGSMATDEDERFIDRAQADVLALVAEVRSLREKP